jgi:hypothetical protein
MLSRPDRLPEVVSLSSQMQLLMQFQIDHHEGPAIDCQESETPLLDRRLEAGGGSWLRFSRLARDLGFHTVHALPMHLGDKVVGAVTFADAEANHFKVEHLDRVRSRVDIATAAVLHVEALQIQMKLADQLESALESRIAIEQAKGMVAVWFRVTPDQAFDVLHRHARCTRTDLHRVAGSIVDGKTAPHQLVGSYDPSEADRRCPAA